MSKKTGLVLTGGGLRGVCAQTGALLALEPLGLRFDAVIGTSAGAIVGAFYGAGKTAPEIEGLLLGLRREDYLDPRSRLSLAFALTRRLQGVTGYYRGRALLEFLRRALAPKTRIEECFPPLALTVTNVSRGIPQIKTTGPLAEYTRASSAIPLVFELQEVDGEHYADGGVANNVPLDELAKLHPELEQLLVLTSLRVLGDEPPVDNRFLSQDWTPARALGRELDAVAEGQRLDNLNVGGRPIQVLRVRTLAFDLDEPEKIPDCIRQAREDAQRQIDDGEVDLSEIPRV